MFQFLINSTIKIILKSKVFILIFFLNSIIWDTLYKISDCYRQKKIEIDEKMQIIDHDYFQFLIKIFYIYMS